MRQKIDKKSAVIFFKKTPHLLNTFYTEKELLFVFRRR